MCKTFYLTDIQNDDGKQCKFCVGDYLGHENVGLETRLEYFVTLVICLSRNWISQTQTKWNCIEK